MSALMPSFIRRFFRQMSIRQAMLLAFLTLIFVPVTLIGYLTYQKSQLIIKNNTRDYTLDVLNGVTRNMEFQMDEINRMYYSIFTNAEVQSGLKRSNEGFQDDLQEVYYRRKISTLLLEAILDRGDIESIQLESLAGDTFSATLNNMPRKLKDLERTRIDTAAGSPVWLDADPVRGVIPAGRMINDLDSQGRLGYIVVNFREKALFDVYSQVKLFAHGDLLIVNDRGRIVSHSDKSLLNTLPDYDFLDNVLNGDDTGFFTHEVDRKLNYITYHTISTTGWKLLSVISSIQYEEEVNALKSWMLMIIGLCTVFTIIASYFLADAMTKPIRKLSRIMQRVEEGTFDVRFNYDSNNEVGILSRNFNSMVARINYLIRKVYQEQLLKQKSELKYLKFQINPHFLFNTLESIHWMAVIQGLPEVGVLTKKLGDLMREGIKGNDFIPLDREIHNITTYMDILEYRYRDKLALEVRVETSLRSIMVPKFILQPLVENAVVHGLEMKMGQGTIHIEGRIVNQQLIITVSDDGVGMTPDKLPSLEMPEGTEAGIGLANVHHRIQLYYGEQFGLSIESEEGQGTTVKIRLPAAQSTLAADK